MNTEVTFRLPALIHKYETSKQLLNEFSDFVGQVEKTKYVFLARSYSTGIENDAVSREQVPPDTHLVFIRIERTGAFVEMKTRSKFKNFNEVSDQTLNQITIHGPDSQAVHALRARVEHLLKPQRLIIRSLFYRYPLFWFWSSLILLWFCEYRVARIIRPSLSLYSPLSALAAMLLFAIALGTMLIYANLVVPIYAYWFPYFEIEGNLSRHRTSCQIAVGAILASLFAAGLWNVGALILN